MENVRCVLRMVYRLGIRCSRSGGETIVWDGYGMARALQNTVDGSVGAHFRSAGGVNGCMCAASEREGGTGAATA